MISKKKNEDAVSPVIGVMLMLVVTVVIAAVVVTFSTGLAGDTKTTPTALFEVSNIEIGDSRSTPNALTLADLNLRHKGGDIIPLSELQITLQSVGGGNSNLMLILTASDSKSSLDLVNSHYTEPDANEIYGYEQQLQMWQMAYDSMIAAGMPANIAEMMAGPKPTYPQSSFEASYTYPLAVLGQSIPTKSTVSTGDIIRVVPYSGGLSSDIYVGTAVKWTISYIPTNSIIAKGEFEVIAD